MHSQKTRNSTALTPAPPPARKPIKWRKKKRKKKQHYYLTTIMLVDWCFEPRQPQTITPGLETNVSLSPSYSTQKSPSRKILQNPQNLSRHKNRTKSIQTPNTYFRKNCRSEITLVTKKKKKKSNHIGEQPRFFFSTANNYWFITVPDVVEFRPNMVRFFRRSIFK